MVKSVVGNLHPLKRQTPPRTSTESAIQRQQTEGTSPDFGGARNTRPASVDSNTQQQYLSFLKGLGSGNGGNVEPRTTFPKFLKVWTQVTHRRLEFNIHTTKSNCSLKRGSLRNRPTQKKTEPACGLLAQNHRRGGGV
jgi:hypothetical protein